MPLKNYDQWRLETPPYLEGPDEQELEDEPNPDDDSPIDYPTPLEE